MIEPHIKKHITRILVSVALFVVAGAGIYYCLPPSQSGRRAVETLSGAHAFSFGPVGIVGSIPEREDAFFAILSSRHALHLFRDLYERGTPEAKLYALYGLRLVHGDFKAYSDRFVREVATVSAQSADVVNTMSSIEAVSGLRQEDFELKFQKYLRMRKEMIEAAEAHFRTNKPASYNKCRGPLST